MNKFLTLLTVLILLIACSSNEDKMTLTGNVKGPVSYTHLTLPTNREV